MRLKIKRKWFTDRSSIGQFCIDTTIHSFSLEDVARAYGVKIPGKTAIPPGEYKVIIDFSQRFMRPMPHVLDVPMFEGVRIHPGNTDVDVEGCIAIGYSKGQDVIWDSRKAFDEFFAKLESAIANGETVILEITNEQA